MKYSDTTQTNAARSGRAVAIVVVIGLLIVAFFGGRLTSTPPVDAAASETASGPALPEKAPVPVRVEKLRRVASYATEREYVGRVEAARDSSLAFERPGRVEEVRFEDGQFVERDQVVARLDTALLKAEETVRLTRVDAERARLDELSAGPREEQIEVAKAEVEQLEADYALATLTAERQRKLFESGSSPEQRYDEARLAMTSLAARLRGATSRLDELNNGTRAEQVTAQEAALARAEAELASIRVDLAKAELRAPFSGQIVSRLIDEGEVVAAGTPIVELVEHSALEVRIGLPGRVADSLALDETVNVAIGDVVCRAVVSRVLAKRVDGVRTVDAVLTLNPEDPNELSSVRDGDTATLVREREVAVGGYWLPLESLVEGVRGLWSCYIVRPGDEGELYVERIPLEVIHTTQNAVYVDGPIAESDEVVIAGVHRLVPDQRVSIAAASD